MSTDLTPDLAGKVLSAEQRNIIKKVGEGGILSATERQLFIGFYAEGAEPEQLRQQRVSALLRKWLDGGRLSAEEKDEIAHVLPEARLVYESISTISSEPGEQAVTKKAMTEKDIMARYEISRATYFRWKQYGLGLPEGQDLPPWDEPDKLVSWYERMRQRGVFKHKCPKALLAAAKQPAGSIEHSAPSSSADEKKTTSSSASGAQRQVSGKRGFLAELEALQEQTALMREGYEAALKKGELDKAANLRAEYFSTLETLRKYEKDKEQIATATGELVRKSDIEKDLGERLPAVVSSLEYLIDSVDPYLIAEHDRSKRRAIWRKYLAECFKGLATSRYAPPFSLAAS